MRTEQPEPATSGAAAAQLLALLPHLAVARVFRSSDGGESWTRADVASLLPGMIGAHDRDRPDWPG
jgi:hypothetical protein